MTLSYESPILIHFYIIPNPRIYCFSWNHKTYHKGRSTLIPFQFTWSILKPAPKFCHKITISHSIASREHAPFTGLVKQARSWKHSIVVEVSDVKSSMNAAIETISRLQIKTASFEYMVTVIPVPKIDFSIM